MGESRKQFEQKIQHSYGEDYLVVNDDGDYVNWITADLWEFWQASREAIEIELPGWDMFDTTRQVLGAVEDELRAAGLRIKEK